MTLKIGIDMIQNLKKCELEAIKIFSGYDKIESDMRLIGKGKADYLERILAEIQPKCKHPTNMRDKADGVWYCMNCNLDL